MTTANVFDPHFDAASETAGFTHRRARVSRQAGCEHLGASLYVIPPGQSTFPYHWHSANEELLIVLRGRPSLRTPEGRRELDEGEVVAFPRGERGAHQMLNRTDEEAQVLVISEMNAPEVNGYPDSGKLGAGTHAPGARADERGIFEFFRRSDAVDYLAGEAPPDPRQGTAE